jgi:hypothetical protein
MSDFQPTPILVLDQEQTLAMIELLESSLPDDLNKFRIKSTWLCSLLNEREQIAGFQYNAQFQAWFEQQFQIGSIITEKNSMLSLLIYNAQCYRRHDALIDAGWTPGETAILERAFKHGRKLEYLGENIIGGSAITTLTVREVHRQLYAFPPRNRNPISIIGQPVRLPPQFRRRNPNHSHGQLTTTKSLYSPASNPGTHTHARHQNSNPRNSCQRCDRARKA